VDLVVLSVFVLVYVGMILGELPGLALDRSGIALLGAIAVLASGRLTLEEAALAVDVHTVALLFGLMVMSAQFRIGGFHSETVRRIAAHSAASLLSPPDAMWRLASYYLQPAAVRSVGPLIFSVVSVPTPVMVWWAAVFTLSALLWAVRSFERRAL
jgi:hypothetical protein